jgi:hypothetical protein
MRSGASWFAFHWGIGVVEWNRPHLVVNTVSGPGGHATGELHCSVAD